MIGNKGKNNTGHSGKTRGINLPWHLALLLVVALIVLSSFVTKLVVLKTTNANEDLGYRSELNVRRIKGYRFIRPLLTAKPAQESNIYREIKETAGKIIAEYKDKGILSSSAVYFRDFNHSDWICINDLEKFIPGSILKLPVLITYLLMEEENPGTLDKKLLFYKPYETQLRPNIITRGIKLGKMYSIKELLEYMIVDSDNNANFLLNDNMDLKKFVKIFNDLNIDVPDIKAPTLPLNIRECSRFLEVLVNSTYLTEKNSEFAMSLLTRTEFKDGIINGINNREIVIAHKFGESGNETNKQLHETAVFYINNQPYLLTIMTKGNKNITLNKLAEVLQKISSAVYSNLIKGN
jgi:beta-lactamase class A